MDAGGQSGKRPHNGAGKPCPKVSGFTSEYPDIDPALEIVLSETAASGETSVHVRSQ